MHIVDVGVNVLKLNHLTSVVNSDQEYTIQDTTISYNVTDVKTYVETIRANKSPVFCQSLIETKVLELISEEINNSLDFNLLGENINVPRCGVTINSIILPSPPKPKTSRNQQQKQNTLDATIDFQQALQEQTMRHLDEVRTIQRKLRDNEESLKSQAEETNKQLEEVNRQLQEANQQLQEVKAERERQVERERERQVERERERERQAQVERERQEQERERQLGSEGSTI
jgi:DNA repair exonuclease SbcCD ATPase subunit